MAGLSRGYICLFCDWSCSIWTLLWLVYQGVEDLLAIGVAGDSVAVGVTSTAATNIELILRFGTGGHLRAGLATITNVRT